jgi:hypothetical protein
LRVRLLEAQQRRFDLGDRASAWKRLGLGFAARVRREPEQGRRIIRRRSPDRPRGVDSCL